MASESPSKKCKTASDKPAGLALVGAAWWAQGWHLPDIAKNPNSKLVAIVQRSHQPNPPAEAFNTSLENKDQLKARYNVPIYSSCEELIADADVMKDVDGVIICTAHHCHASMGKLFLDAGKHILMEKPMTADVAEARELAAAAEAALPRQVFMVNNTANFRDKCFDARRLVESGELGAINHVLCVMYSPLLGLFDDPKNEGWVKPTGTMVQSDGSGNGFGWGQLSHLLAWPIMVGALEVQEVTAMTHRSEKSGADLMDAALIRCVGNVSISVSGGCGWPGNQWTENAGKWFDIKMFGTKGVLMYSGDDTKPESGRLELRKHDGSPSYISEGFLMENGAQGGIGPESLQQFIAACQGKPFKNGADHNVGMQAVKFLDAFYRSAASGKTEATR